MNRVDELLASLQCDELDTAQPTILAADLAERTALTVAVPEAFVRFTRSSAAARPARRLVGAGR